MEIYTDNIQYVKCIHSIFKAFLLDVFFVVCYCHHTAAVAVAAVDAHIQCHFQKIQTFLLAGCATLRPCFICMRTRKHKINGKLVVATQCAVQNTHIHTRSNQATRPLS